MKINFKRGFALSLLIAVPVSALLVLLGYYLRLRTSTLMILYAVFVAVFALCWIGYLISLQRKLQDIEELLYDQKDPLSYIKDTEKFLTRIRSERVRPLIWLNLSAGYAAMDVFPMADRILQSIDPAGMTEINQAIYYCYKAQYAFCRGNYSEGASIVEERDSLLRKYMEEETLACRIATVYAFYYMASQDWKEAEQYALTAENTCRDSYRMDFVLYLKLCLAAHAGNYELAGKLKDSLMENHPTAALSRMTTGLKITRKAG